jgi:hypothetical protein
MSSIWRQLDGGWHSLPLGEGASATAEDVPGVRFFRYRRGPEGGTVLIVRPGERVWVNGQPVLGGLRVLQHRDEILAGRVRLYFSAETTPLVVVFRLKQGARSPTCPVCRGAIKDGDLVVQCPGCSRWYHQLEAAGDRPAKKCWTYAETCLCQHPTSLSGAPVWRPEMEENRD